MNKWIWLLTFLCLSAAGLRAQMPALQELLAYPDQPDKKLEQTLTRLGFAAVDRTHLPDTVYYTWKTSADADSSKAITRSISKCSSNGTTLYFYQTTSRDEFARLLAEGERIGVACAEPPSVQSLPLLLQYQQMLMLAYVDQSADMKRYTLRIEKKPLPAVKQLQWAEQLLLFDSDELLAAYFGRDQVKKDLYYFSEKEINRCSILFPNTPRQAIFIWEDQANRRVIDQIIIGSMTTSGQLAGYAGALDGNTWQFRNGIEFNMRLDQLLHTNEEDIQFYGRRSPYYLMLKPGTKGKVDFSGTGIVFDCLNCVGDPFLNTELVSGKAAVTEGLRLHISLVILWPASGIR